jgi:D-mannonate dehydratase
MEFILNKLSIQNFQTGDNIYSKQIRNKLGFNIETHHLNNGKTLQVFFYRNHPRIKEIIEKFGWEHVGLSSKSSQKVKVGSGTYKLIINDKDFMIHTDGDMEIEVEEYNFYSKKQQFVDFKQGKLAVLFTFNLEKEFDNSKIKTELKKFMEENNG